jgi:prepilin-type N-terminal cleavage/methylation domain-containing protein
MPFRAQKGFTLIETLVYLALFTVVMGGGLTAVYGIIESESRSSGQVELAEEANFLLAKIDRLLADADAAAGGVVAPSVGAGPALTVHVFGEATSVSLALSGTNMVLIRGVGPPTALSGGMVAVTDLEFVRTSRRGRPDAITASFTLSGASAKERFEITRYLRP